MTTAPRATVPALKRSTSLESVIGEHGVAWVFLAPTLIVLAILVGGGMLYALFLSLNRVEFIGGQPEYELVGLSNYTRFVSDERFLQALGQTALFTVVRVVATLALALLIALTLNQKLPFLRVVRSLFLIPWALASVVNGLMWGWIFHGNFGVANAILQGLGIIPEYRSWLGDPATALWAIMFADVWKAVPFASLILLAALQSVPAEQHDAARVDGANAWERFIHVTLPWLRPVTLVLLVIETMWALKAFDLVWVLTKGGPLDSSMLLNVYAYQQTFQFFNFGYGAALAYFVAILILGLTAVYFSLLRDSGHDA